MKKITESTYGAHAFMRMELNNGIIGEIDVFWRESGESYRTNHDDNPEIREMIIAAFNKLY